MTQPIRILAIAHQYWPIPGAATLRLGKFVEQLDFVFPSNDVVVLTTRDQNPRTQGTASLIGQNNERIFPLRTPDATGQSARRVLLILRFAVEAWIQGMRVGPVDVVLSDPPPFSGLAAILVAKRRKAVSVYYFCDSWALVAKRGGLAGRLSSLLRMVENLCLKHADIVLASEHSLASEAKARGARQVVLALNGADIERIAASQSRKKSVQSTSSKYFLYAGTHSEVHGARIFVEAAKLLWAEGKEFELRFVGSGSDAAWVKEQSQLSSGRIAHRDSVSLEDLVPMLGGAVASLVSLGDVPPNYYATPSKIYTSLAVGCPILYSGVRSPVSFIEDQQLGWLAPRNAAAVAQAMSECLDFSEANDSERQQLVARCEDFARTHRNFKTNLRDAGLAIRDRVLRQRSDSER